jgi:hypothetical protein
MVVDHLTKANRHVAEAERHVAQQREIVAQLEREGHDYSDAKELLARFEELQALHIADRDRLQRELAEIQPDSLPNLRNP